MSMPAPAHDELVSPSDGNSQMHDPRIVDLLAAIQSGDTNKLTRVLERIGEDKSDESPAVFDAVAKAGLTDAFVNALILRGESAAPDDAWNKAIDEGLKEIDAALAKATDNSERSALLAQRLELNMARGDIRGAIASLEQQVAVVSEPESRMNLRLAQARSAARIKDWNEAAARFDQALKEVPPDRADIRGAVQIEKVQTLLVTHFDSVVPDLDELDASWPTPGWPPTIDLRVSGLLTSHRANEALQWLEQRLDRAPHLKGHPAAHQVRAEIHFKLGNTAAALDESRLAVDIAPETTDPRAWGAAMMGAFASQQWALVRSIYERLTTLVPTLEPTAQVIAAIAYARSGNAERALSLTEQAVTLPPQFMVLRDQARAESQLRLGRFRDAAQTASDALKRPDLLAESIASLQLVRAQAFNELKDFSGARAAATAVLDLESGQTVVGVSDVLRIGALMQRSLAFFRDNDVTAAHRDVDDAIRRLNETRSVIGSLMTTPEFSSLEPQVWLAKGVLLEHENRNEESLAAYTRASNLETNGNAGAIKRGYALSHVGAFDDAVVAFDVALSRAASESETAAARVGKGRTLLRLRRYEEAIAALHAALDALLLKPGDDAVVFESLGIAYDGLGRKDAALKAFQQARSLARDEKQKRNLAAGISSGYLNLRNPQAALDFLDSLEPDLQQDRALLFNRALALNALGQRKAAIRHMIEAKDAGLQEAQAQLDRLDVPAGLTRWTYYWFGEQASRRRYIVGIVLAIVAALALPLAPTSRWWLSGSVDWYLLLLPSFAALILLALPNISAIGYEDGKLKISAEPLAASARAATASPISTGTEGDTVLLPAVPQGVIVSVTPTQLKVP